MKEEKTNKKSLRRKDVPIIWCAGKGNVCGYYNFLTQLEKVLLRHMEEKGLTKDDINVVAGIGCSSRLPFYQDFHAFHTTHGNAVSFAEGMNIMLKVKGRKDLVYTVGGDGDQLAIGVSNFVNACRDNVDMTIFMLNNEIYGMTSGQTSPTTPTGTKTKSAPYGTLEAPWDPTNLALAAGATYVARVSAFPQDSKTLEEFIYNAFTHKGTAVVIVDSPCPTQNPNHKSMLNKEIAEIYFSKLIDLSKIFPKSSYKGETRKVGNLELTPDQGIVVDDNLAELLNKDAEINARFKYEVLRSYLNNNGGNELILRGKIIDLNRMILSEAIIKQRKEVLSKYPKGAKRSEMASSLLKGYEL